MVRILSALDRLVAGAGNVAVIVAGALCLLMSVHIVADVVMRTVFNMPLPGTVAIVSNYYMVAVTFLPLAMVERIGAHISVEIVVERFSAGIQRHIQALVWLMSCGVAGLLAVATWREAAAKTRIGAYVMESGHHLPLWPAYYFLPFGCALLALVYALRVLGYLSGQPLGGDPVAHDTIEVDHFD